jgi:hypothetical protein
MNVNSQTCKQISNTSNTFNNRLESKVMSSNRQAGGHKANLNNPNTSEESKDRSREALEGNSAQHSGSHNQNSGGSNSHEGKNPGNGIINL